MHANDMPLDADGTVTVTQMTSVYEGKTDDTVETVDIAYADRAAFVEAVQEQYPVFVEHWRRLQLGWANTKAFLQKMLAEGYIICSMDFRTVLRITVLEFIRILGGQNGC